MNDVIRYLEHKQAKAKVYQAEYRSRGKTTDAEFFGYAAHLYAALIGELQAGFHKSDDLGPIDPPPAS